MSDTTNSSPSSPRFPTLSDIGDALSDITSDDGESAIHPRPLSGIAMELFLVEAHYATEEAGLRKQIEELESTVRCQAKSMAHKDVIIKIREEEVELQEGIIERRDKSIDEKNETIKRQGEFLKVSDSRIATLLGQLDTLQSKGEHQSPYRNKIVCVPSPASTLMQVNPFATPSVSPASTPVRIDVFSDKRANSPAKSVSTLEAALHPSVKPVVSTPTTTANTPAILLPTPKTTLTTPDKPVPSPTPRQNGESKFSFGKPAPFFTFGDPIPVSRSKFARGLKPHHTHTRSKSAELRASPAMSPFSSQKPFEEPEGWKPEDWNKYLRFGPPTAENVF
ncbi:hypothetical protein V490_05339 [Pseudogymnoascus sp. VKM F-3557]|nr:hypothetical protein V490_05339 [Pseudogymnoascus sp. VKM F-3557]